MLSWIKMLRPHHWFKNFLILVPVLFSPRIFDFAIYPSFGLTFAAFCLLSSSVYAFNDVLDGEADAAHPWKKLRPVASGAIGIKAALAMSLVLALAGLAVAYASSMTVMYFGLLYLAVATLYSVGLKKIMLMDVASLASLYVLRVWAGFGTADLEISPRTMILPSFLLFLSFALFKRASELEKLQPSGRLPGRSYTAAALPLARSVGRLSGALALALFLLLAPGPAKILVLILASWTYRLWTFGGTLEDPVTFAIADRFTWTCAASLAGLILFQAFL